MSDKKSFENHCDEIKTKQRAKRMDDLVVFFGELIIDYGNDYGKVPGCIFLSRVLWKEMDKSGWTKFERIPFVLDSELEPGTAECGELH